MTRTRWLRIRLLVGAPALLIVGACARTGSGESHVQADSLANVHAAEVALRDSGLASPLKVNRYRLDSAGVIVELGPQQSGVRGSGGVVRVDRARRAVVLERYQ